MILIGFTSSLAQFGARCSVQGPGARFRGQGLVQGPVGAWGSVQGPGAWFRAQVLGSGARALFRAQVLG